MKLLEWANKNVWQLIILFLFLIIGITTCTKRGWMDNVKQGPDTVFTTKTEYIPQAPVFIPQYIPTQTGSQQPIIIPSQYQPSQDLTTLIKQYQDLANKFLAQNTYVDSIQLKDSSGRRVGVVNLQDMVSENQIKTRKPSYQLTFPITTNTFTITQQAKSRAKFYVGASLAGEQEKVLKQAGIGLIYNSKRDALWGIKANYEFGQGFNYELSRYWKLSFRK